MQRIAILALTIGEEFARCMTPGLKPKSDYWYWDEVSHEPCHNT